LATPHQDPNGRLLTAVAARDADAVQACLQDGADPNTPGQDGLPLLCAAVAGFDHETAAALTDGGADPDRELPDGTTPLLRAVDIGSPALVDATLGKDPRLRLAEADRQRLLGLARHWYETGEAEELRRRTRAAGPVARHLVEDDPYTVVEEVSLDGLTVRAGHGAVLTSLEWRFGVQPPVPELITRAVRYPDGRHVDWSAAESALAHRRSPQAWSALSALRRHPDPVHRRFLAGVLWHRRFLTDLYGRRDTGQDPGFLAVWALDEPDGQVLAKVLDVYTNADHADQEAVGLRHAHHPDPRVRREVPYCLSRYGTPPSEAATAALLALARDPDPGVRGVAARALAAEGRMSRDLPPAIREALLVLLKDSDPDVRAAAAASLSGSHDRTAAVTEAFVALSDEEDQILRLEAAFALALRDDPRTDQAYERVGLLGPGFEDDHRVSAHWHYHRRNRRV
jgi:hypothetical protein